MFIRNYPAYSWNVLSLRWKMVIYPWPPPHIHVLYGI